MDSSEKCHGFLDGSDILVCALVGEVTEVDFGLRCWVG
jgi:hypothetical protein